MRVALRAWLAALLLAQAAVAESQPGVRCDFEPANGVTGEALLARAAAPAETRVVDRIALRVQPGEPGCDGLAPGPFRATWRGRLVLDVRSKLRFAVRGRGHVRLRLNDKVVFSGGSDSALSLESVDERWPQGENAFELDYASPTDGQAEVRLLWAGRGFDWEPVPAALWRHDEDPGALVRLRRQRGRELFLEHRCTACHSLDAATQASLQSTGPPELLARAPRLDDAGARLNGRWLVEWLIDPASKRPGARMPRLFDENAAGASGDGTAAAHARAGRAEAKDVAAWLLTRGTKPIEPSAATPSATPAQIAAGGALFAQLGCIGCHTRPESRARVLADDRIPLDRVAEKWRPEALAAFLEEPGALDPWIRMPDLDLSSTEAAALAAFLTERSRQDAPATDFSHGDAERGRTLYATLGCSGCHEPTAGGLVAPPLAALAALDWASHGCVAEDGPSARPVFDFSPDERAALAAFASGGLATLAHGNRADFAARQLRELRCAACHTIGAERDRWQSVIAETDDLRAALPRPELDQARPALTFIGEKLHSDWIAGLLRGETAPRIRPWLDARMPAFKHRAERLAEGLAARDGVAPGGAVPAAADREQSEAAHRLLFDPVKGFACVNCHDIGEEKARSRFEFGTPNLDRAAERIRPDYYRRWMANPLRVEPSSKMPSYAGDDGKSPFTDLFAGDLSAQFEAIRRWLSDHRRGGR